MLQNLFQFLFLFGIVITASYFVHIGIINAFSLQRNMDVINLSYLFNSVFTILFTSGIILVSKRFKDQLGFIFMGGGLIKIATFIIVSKLNDLEIDKNVFLDFFIAYLICLILEVYYVSKILNSNKYL
ncbi:hypothetical protein [Aquimarina sp. 2201CG5-10]|uniref:hypothetical protein n=1 Tax=Aquimarina callyspongiae TaxID=3098150 RepID=UPI002AB4E613|nr:hypothetical protein [Aquimarina sp. 2201CG5-10]MDY8138705.1 hypothetical protein [Aquimarina sp. 2201CG5-10]